MSALVLALNPCIDAEWRVPRVLWEEKNTVLSERRWAGGKGVNVARWLKHLGGKPLLLLPLGGETGHELAGHLRKGKLPIQIVQLDEPTRVNVVLTTDTGRQMRFNQIGPRVSKREWRSILAESRRFLARADLLILSGSLPRGLAGDAYAALIRLARQFRVRTLLDCDGPVFMAAVKARPFLVKPNAHELAQWWGQPLRTEQAILRAARALSGRTRGWVLVSRGAERAWLVNEAEGFECFAWPSRVRPRNTLGAGDALLAAAAREIQRGSPPENWLRAGVRTSSAAVRLDAGRLPGTVEKGKPA